VLAVWSVDVPRAYPPLACRAPALAERWNVYGLSHQRKTTTNMSELLSPGSIAKDALLQAIERHVSVRELTRLYVAYILDRKNGNKSHAARMIKVDRRTIQRWTNGAKRGVKKIKKDERQLELTP
jgi:hypothetical protein